MLVAGASGAALGKEVKALLVSGWASSLRAQVASCPIARQPVRSERSLCHT